MVETSFSVRDAQRTERAIPVQSELRWPRPDVLGGQIAGTESDGVFEDVVPARLRGQRPSRGTVGQELDFQGTPLASRSAVTRRAEYLSFSGRCTSSMLHVIFFLVFFKIKHYKNEKRCVCGALVCWRHVENDALPVSYALERARRGSLGIGQDGVYHAVIDGQPSSVCLASPTRALLLRIVADEF